jgi:hypothetical protein
VHVVAEGVLLVSPGIFQDFAKLHKDVDSWEAVQKKFLKLGLHERSEGGLKSINTGFQGLTTAPRS